MTGRVLARAALLSAAAASLHCGGPGAYGHAPRYVPTRDESRAAAGARPYEPRLAERRLGATTTLFGVVESRAVGPSGGALLRLGVRGLASANQCARPGVDESCRVTVRDEDLGTVWALVALRAEDDVGPQAVGPGSLVRIVGTIAQDVSPIDGRPVIHVTFYRHFPPGEYVARPAR